MINLLFGALCKTQKQAQMDTQDDNLEKLYLVLLQHNIGRLHRNFLTPKYTITSA